MGMQIYVQKLSVPSEEWSSIDVESSDTIAGVKSKLSVIELPAVYDPSYIKLFFEGTELQNNFTLSYYNIQKNSHLSSSYDAAPNPPYIDEIIANWGSVAEFQRIVGGTG